MLSHVLDEVGGLLPVGELLGQGEAGLDGRGCRQVLLAEVPSAFRRVRLAGVRRRVGRWRRHLEIRRRRFQDCRSSNEDGSSVGLFNRNSGVAGSVPHFRNSSLAFGPKLRMFFRQKILNLKIELKATIFWRRDVDSSPAVLRHSRRGLEKVRNRSFFGRNSDKKVRKRWSNSSLSSSS